jgi:hypothetical protein
MKTFLHYTKEKELDEGILSTIAGIGGKVVGGIAKVGDVVGSIADSPLTKAMGTPGGKPGATLRGALGTAQSARSASEKSAEETSELNNAVVDADDLVKSLRRKLVKAKTPEDKAYYKDALASAEERLKAIVNAKSKKELAIKSRQNIANKAANIRSTTP